VEDELTSLWIFIVRFDLLPEQENQTAQKYFLHEVNSG
jgi:hypothetical protein